jgi:hypothetical protein
MQALDNPSTSIHRDTIDLLSLDQQPLPKPLILLCNCLVMPFDKGAELQGSVYFNGPFQRFRYD